LSTSPAVSSRPLIVYGNCQADAITLALRKDAVVQNLYDVSYYRSFDHPTEGTIALEERVVRNCSLLCEQHDRQAFPLQEMLPAHCVTVKFPAVDLNVLWPFNCVNPYNAPEPPTFPFGRFAYGDRAIVNAIDRGMSADDVLDYYLNRWDDYKVDLDRLLKLEQARLAARDARCDVQIADFVLSRFRKERLFWTINHPTTVLIREVIDRLLHACGKAQPALEDADMENTLAAHFPPAGPLGVVGVPIHPKVAEHLELEWYDPNERYHSWDGKTYSYVEYFEGMIRTAFEIRAAGAAVPTLVQ
jgi:hypothetical protein